MYQEHDFHLETSGIPRNIGNHPGPPADSETIVNCALGSISSRAGSMLNRKKGMKKYPCSRGFLSSSTIYRVQPGIYLGLPTTWLGKKKGPFGHWQFHAWNLNKAWICIVLIFKAPFKFFAKYVVCMEPHSKWGHVKCRIKIWCNKNSPCDFRALVPSLTFFLGRRPCWGSWNWNHLPAGCCVLDPLKMASLFPVLNSWRCKNTKADIDKSITEAPSPWVLAAELSVKNYYY